ncbi:hypothetical protein GF1_29490 [Desulfolithobacter dissulfuricans]|uniref:Cytochrome C n=1 Tax=Desulfolithobacter dissulfuricans TaxID=2795293 RepID=A0A915XLD7_9BACT|nr:hypothetical protein [Desulfolithobacter dissulfuricans]BCO10573.1 hypothetical protein GF1_29490 [Desulfolithobacter dissulfuricans]
MKKSTQRTLIAATCLGLVFVLGRVTTLSAQEADSSSACINCHTDLEEMDSYGAASASGGAAIAG